ncbi:MAG: IS1595 family transposase [Bacteroidetes bacterium]|nr:IS1595 family transposase [Bacteroidota bacterium]
MQTQFKSVLQILDYYKDNETCVKLLEQQLWNGGEPVCPHCAAVGAYKTNRGYRCKSKGCQKKFTVTTGTIYENTKIGLRIWFAAIYLITAHRKGISSHQLSRDLNVTQKTAWFILHRVREMLKAENPSLLEGEIEVDATYYGGERKNKHAKKRKELTEKFGRGTLEKQAMVGLLERNGNVTAFKVESEAGKIVKPIIKDRVSKNAKALITDAHGGYKDLHFEFNHVVINHQGGEYAKGSFHTNNIEGFWSQFKRGIKGIQHHVSIKHLDRYCNEYAYRYNVRAIADGERFSGVLKNSYGRLRYSDLIGKGEDAGELGMPMA